LRPAPADADREEPNQRTTPSELAAYGVTFGRQKGVYSARIATRVPEHRAAERSLQSRASDCSALARAVAITLALLLDTEPAAAGQALPAAAPLKPAPATPVTPTPLPPTAAAADSGSARWQLGLGLSGAVQFAVIRSVAPELAAEIALFTPHWRLGVGAAYTPMQTWLLAPGYVNVELWTAAARVCHAPWQRLSRVFQVSACTGARVGRSQASAHDFTRNEHRARPYVAIPVELSTVYFAAHLALELHAGVLLPIVHDEFAVDSAGSAYRPARLGGAIGLRVWGLLF
jgi:hypothetical protein